MIITESEYELNQNRPVRGDLQSNKPLTLSMQAE